MTTTSVLGPFFGEGFAQRMSPRRFAAAVTGFESVMESFSCSLGPLRGIFQVATVAFVLSSVRTPSIAGAGGGDHRGVGRES